MQTRTARKYYSYPKYPGYPERGHGKYYRDVPQINDGYGWKDDRTRNPSAPVYVR